MLLLPGSTNPTRPLARTLRALAMAFACAQGVVAALPDAAQAASDGVRERALRLAREGRCTSALPELDAARAASPEAAQDAELALRSGQCRMRLHRYPEAARDLAEAARLAPADGETQLALAKARYHARDLPGARTALEAAGSLRPDDAEVALYRGMLQIEAGDDAAAIASLARALRLDAERVDPVASYHLAMARARTRDASGAETDLRRVADAWQGTDWSTRAEQELARLRDGRARHAWLGVGAGIEYDTNVVLLGRGVPEPADISDERDGLGVWTANGGAELWKGERATVGAMASYRGTTHFELHDFDAHFPSATTWLDVDLSEDWLASARYDFGYAWLDGDPFLSTNGGQLALQRALGSWGASQAYARAHLDDYFYDSDDVPDSMGGMSPCGGAPFCGPPGLDERSARRRSGWGLETGLEHVLPIDTGMQALSDLALRGGYAFGLFDSRGREYTHHRSTWRVGASARLPFQVGADVSGSYAYRQYRHPSTFPDPPLVPNAPYTLSGVRRREQTFVVETALSRPITRQVVVSARWRYVDNESNRKVFDYEQQVFGLYLDVSIGREL